MNDLYFTKSLAEAIAFDFHYLIGNETFPTRMGELKIDNIKVIEVNNNEFDIILTSRAINTEYREIYQVLNLTSMRLMKYIELKQVKFYPNRYGIGYCQISNAKDENGIDMYL